jgi:G3E family GTPase
MAPRRVAACVITGFLGSGKTTLLKGLLDREPGRDRIAVIVNELGEIGIDGRVLTGFEFVENVVELASGCVCCSIDEYRFDLAVEELVRRIDPVLVVLETTGVADPGPTLERLRRCGLGVDAVITVVDGKSWQAAWRVSGSARRQVTAADFIVISKVDLMTPRALGRLRGRLARLNPRALVLEGAADRPFPGAQLLLATTAAREAGATMAARKAAATPAGAHGGGAAATDHLREDLIESFSWRSSGAVDRVAFEKMMKRLAPRVLRAKGFLRCPGDRTAWLFQLVCGRFEMNAFEGAEAVAAGVQGVFLGPGIAALRGEIASAIAACETPPPGADRSGPANCTTAAEAKRELSETA